MIMTTQSRKQKASDRKAQRERADAVTAAVADEMQRFNAAIRAGAVVRLGTHCGSHQVSHVSTGFWYYTPEANGGFGCSWAGCNDATWARLLHQAGVVRHPLFATLA